MVDCQVSSSEEFRLRRWSYFGQLDSDDPDSGCRHPGRFHRHHNGVSSGITARRIEDISRKENYQLNLSLKNWKVWILILQVYVWELQKRNSYELLKSLMELKEDSEEDRGLECLKSFGSSKRKWGIFSLAEW